MKVFSATDAAFEGFRVTREQPRVVLVWAVFHFVAGILVAALMVSVGGESFMALQEQGQAGEQDPAAALAQFRDLAPLYAVLLPFSLALPAITGAAVYRVVLGRGDPSWAYLRFGPDELRLIALTAIYFLLALAALFVSVIVASLAAALLAPAGGALVGIGVAVFMLGLLVFVAVRLSLAPVITFAENRLAVFDSWGLTRGHFWRLLGAYLLAVASIIVVLLLAMIIFVALAAALVGGDLERVGTMFNPDLSSFGAYFTPRNIAYVAFSSVLTAIYYAVLLSPAAYAYRSLVGGEAAAASEL